MTCENGGWCKLSQVNDPYGYGVYVIWCADAISRSATPADADLGAVLMNDQLLIVVIVIGLQIAFVAIARAFPAILGAALVKTIEHRYAVRLSRLKADLESRYTTLQTSVNFLAANQSELRSKTITAVQTLWTSILAIEQELRDG